MQIQKAIEQLGFSRKEAKVYLAALRIGAAHVTDIAAASKLPRSTVQAVIEKLHGQGLVNFYVMRRYKFWVVENPERLISQVKEREEIAQHVLPQLLEMRKSARQKVTREPTIPSALGPVKVVADEVVQGVLITNAHVEIEYVNAAWEKLFGYTLHEVYGKNPSLFASEQTPIEEYERLWHQLQTKNIFLSDKIFDTKKDGTTFGLCTSIFMIEHNGATYYVQVLDACDNAAVVKDLKERINEVAHKSPF